MMDEQNGTPTQGHQGVSPQRTLERRLRVSTALNLGLGAALCALAVYHVVRTSPPSGQHISEDGRAQATVSVDEQRSRVDVGLSFDDASANGPTTKAFLEAARQRAQMGITLEPTKHARPDADAIATRATIALDEGAAQFDLSADRLENGQPSASTTLRARTDRDSTQLKLCLSDISCVSLGVTDAGASIDLAGKDDGDVISLQQRKGHASIRLASQQGEITLTVDPDSSEGALIRVKQPSGRAMELRPGALVFINDDGTERGRVDHTSCVAEAATEAQP